jgi:hypothetical protein
MLVVTLGTVQSVVSVINFDSITPFKVWKKSHYFYDKTYVPILSNISNYVPSNTPIVISSLLNAQPKFFIKHQLITPPSNVTSKSSLLHYMVKNNLSYLLVFENFSKQEKLKPVFSTTGLKVLETDFQEIANYTTKSQFKLHLYQISKAWIT